MCLPLLAGAGALGTIGTVASIAGTAFSFIQSRQQAAAADAAAQQQLDVSAAAAADATRRGERESALRRLQSAQDVSSQRSALAASGFDVNTGSALTRQFDVGRTGEIEAQTISSNASREAGGIVNQGSARSTRLRNQASATRGEGIGSLITNASQVSSKWQALRRSSPGRLA